MSSHVSDLPDWIVDLFDAIDNQALDRFVEFLGPDAVFRFGSSPAVTGHEAIRESVGGFFTAIHGLEHTVTRFWDGPGRLVCEGTVTYTRLDNSKITLPFTDVFGMNNGLIDEYLIYMDITPLFAN